jgi:hypothetical protein
LLFEGENQGADMEPFTSPSWNPEWIWGVALIIFALFLAYATMQWRKRTARQKQIGDEAAKRNFRSG